MQSSDNLRRAARPAGFALILAVLAVTGIGVGGSPSRAAKIDGEAVPLHHIPAGECRECHAKIYKQWRRSMHANSTAFSDPIHRAFYKLVVGDPGEEGVKHKASGKYPVCLQCHAPNAAQDGKTKLDALPAYKEGVNCVVCHRLKRYKGIRGEDGKLQLGLKAYEVSDICQGPTGFMAGGPAPGEEWKNPHLKTQKPYVSADDVPQSSIPVESNPGLLKTSAACMGCHDQRNNPQGVPLCQTGNEFAQGKSHVTCQSCHMPISGGFADHSMGGGHDPAMLRRSLVLQLDAKRNGKAIDARVTIHNQQPHKMPTGAPFRNVVLKITAFGVDGNRLWQNFEKHPAGEDDKAYMVYKLVDDHGNPAPPPTAAGVGEDTRLAPYEKRTLTYTIPAADVTLVRAELFYNLLWPSLTKKFDFLPEHLREPQRFAFSEAAL